VVKKILKIYEKFLYYVVKKSEQQLTIYSCPIYLIVMHSSLRHHGEHILLCHLGSDGIVCDGGRFMWTGIL
jgi:hypothetical protein